MRKHDTTVRGGAAPLQHHGLGEASTAQGSRSRVNLITVVISCMALAHSKVTAQGQVSVPARVRQRLGVGPGSVLEWDEDGDQVVVRKAGRYSSEDIHRALFATPPARRSLQALKDGVRQSVRKRHASH
jgi:AbrB family looped-hinge helix DNA binding protein